MPLRENRYAVYALLVSVMLIWGLNISAVKALTAVLDEVWVGLLRMLVASITLTLVVWLRKEKLPRLKTKECITLIFAGFLMVYINQLLFTKGAHMSSASTASLIMALNPALAVGMAAIAFRQRIAMLSLPGLAIGFTGVALVVLNQPQASQITVGAGELVVLVALLTFLGGGLMVQVLGRRLDPLVISWLVHVIGTGMLIVHVWAVGDTSLTPNITLDTRMWALTLYSGVIGSALASVMWYFAIGVVGIGRASLFFYWLPIFGISFAAIFLGETLTAWHAAGIMLVMLGTRLSMAQGSAIRIK